MSKKKKEIVLFNSPQINTKAFAFLESRIALKTRTDSPDPFCSGGSGPISHDPHGPLTFHKPPLLFHRVTTIPHFHEPHFPCTEFR